MALISSRLAFHPKILSAGNAATGLWLRLASYCLEYGTDGFVHRRMVHAMSTRRVALRARRAGLLIPHEQRQGFMVWGLGELLRAERIAIPDSARERLLQSSEGRCALCGLPVDRSDVHVDHAIPLARGGTNALRNLQIAHPTCNLRKGAS